MSCTESLPTIDESTIPPGAWAPAVESGEASNERSYAQERLRSVCERFVTIGCRGSARTPDLLHETAAGLHVLAAAISQCERAGLERSHVLAYLQGVRSIHAESPLVHRLQAWPRGYPGDFETVEWLCDARNRAEPETLPWAIEQCALQSPIAQQHRNKVALQARAILRTLHATPTARVASIGCGGCRDLSLIQCHVSATHGAFVLVDADRAALTFARERLDRLQARCTFVQGRVPRVLTKIRDHGPFDLVVAGGLFDYLPDPWASATLKAARRMLRPGGRFLFSNMAGRNPFRPWIEYLADWQLIEREEDDLRKLLVGAGFQADHVHITRDTTGLALMAEAVVTNESNCPFDRAHDPSDTRRSATPSQPADMIVR